MHICHDWDRRIWQVWQVWQASSQHWNITGKALETHRKRIGQRCQDYTLDAPVVPMVRQFVLNSLWKYESNFSNIFKLFNFCNSIRNLGSQIFYNLFNCSWHWLTMSSCVRRCWARAPFPRFPPGKVLLDGQDTCSHGSVVFTLRSAGYCPARVRVPDGFWHHQGGFLDFQTFQQQKGCKSHAHRMSSIFKTIFLCADDIFRCLFLLVDVSPV